MSAKPLVSRREPPNGDTPETVIIGERHGIATPVVVGGPEFVVAAGPCSVEGRDMILETARTVGGAGARLLRGGAYKPRSSPYTFQGLGRPALDHLAEARETSGLAVVTEVLDVRLVPQVARVADVLQIGARNMQNVPLLTAAGETGLPVLIKRGFSATIQELLHAAEYVLVTGNRRVILCERGIRTFETATRNTLDISAIPVLKRETHLPVIVDPSHAAGDAGLVIPLARAALAVGADGLLVEVHPDPDTALSDGEQSLSFDAFARLMVELERLAVPLGRRIGATSFADRGVADTATVKSGRGRRDISSNRVAERTA
jgi:3-deoxy-7-phosphoheptulonate synthase